VRESAGSPVLSAHPGSARWPCLIAKRGHADTISWLSQSATNDGLASVSQQPTGSSKVKRGGQDDRSTDRVGHHAHPPRSDRVHQPSEGHILTQNHATEAHRDADADDLGEAAAAAANCSITLTPGMSVFNSPGATASGVTARTITVAGSRKAPITSSRIVRAGLASSPQRNSGKAAADAEQRGLRARLGHRAGGRAGTESRDGGRDARNRHAVQDAPRINFIKRQLTSP
jgi:hypothetical protein